MDTLFEGLPNGAATTAETVYDVQRVFVLVTAIPYFILVWDWLSNLPNEYRLFMGSSSYLSTGAGAGGGSSRPRITGGPGGVWSLRNAFLLSRYITLLWCTFVVIIYGLAGRHPHLCSWAKYFPYGYSTTMLSAHLVMVLRVNAVFERKKKVAIFLVALAIIDYAVQMSANHAATAIYLRSGNPQISTCFIIPTSLVYALVFASPTIFHHIMLGMTLYKSIQHIRATRSAGVNSIMRVIQRDQVLFVLAICLINFANLVLVFQRASWPYRLINQLPAAAFTQIFLSRIIFSLRSMQKKLATAASSPAITTIPAWPGSPLQFSPRSGLGITTLTVTETGDKDVESGRHSRASDISKKLPLGTASPPPLAAENGKSKNNVFALHFKPSGGRFSRSSRRSSDDKFRVKTRDPATESHVLSSYRMPSPTTGGSDSAVQLESPISPYASRYYDGSTAAPSVASASQSPISPSFTAVPSVLHRPSLQQSTSRLSEGTGLGISVPDMQGSETADAVSSSDENHTVSRSKAEDEEKEGPAAAEAQEPPRTSLDTIDGRRPGTIDEQQRTMDWDPPSTWESSHSARASPIPFSERRLSNSVSRSPVPMALQRSRRASAATQQQQPNQGRSSFSSLPGASGVQQQRPNRGSACYASVFSFDNEEAVDEDEDGVSLGRGRHTLASRVRKSSEVARRSFSAFTSMKQA